MIISISSNWDDARAEHRAFLKRVIERYFRAAMKQGGPHTITFGFIRQVEALLHSSDLQDVTKSIITFEAYKKKAGDFREQFVIELQKIFSYDNFIKKKVGWDAYKLCEKSRIKVCPYCHQVDAKTVLDSQRKRGYRPPLDHFYYKDAYPHLALTLSNLIPACTNCNTSLKGSADFHKYQHLHPLFDSEQISFHLYHPLKNSYLLDMLESDPNGIKIGVSARRSGCDTTKRSLETFMIVERYAQSLCDAVEYANAKLAWENLQANPQLNLTTNEKTLTRFDRGDYRSRTLGKLFADIHDLLAP